MYFYKQKKTDNKLKLKALQKAKKNPKQKAQKKIAMTLNDFCNLLKSFISIILIAFR